MLKQLKLRKEIELKKKEEEKIRAKEEELMKREAELAQSLEESETEEDLNLVNEEIDKLEAEKKENDENKAKVEKEIEDLENELKDIEEKEAEQEKPEVSDDNSENERNIKKYENEGRKNKMKRFEVKQRMTREERKEFVEREDVNKFLKNVQKAVKQRSIEGVDLTIPDILMDMIMDNLGSYSVLYSLVRVVPISGRGRANIIGEAPEAIWTEMIAKINELEYNFGKVEVDGYKVGGYVPVDNSVIEDSLINLSVTIEELLTESIAIAIDKAILYGKGTKMPKGIITAINANADIKDTNIVSLTAANSTLAKILEQFKNIKRGKRNRGQITVLMSETTWFGTILPLSLATNANGAYVSALNGVFPGTGYKVEFCEELPENNMLVGDFSKYLLAERKGKQVASSTEAKFIEDITLFKATARYDGIPTRESAFVLIGLKGVTPTKEVSFAPDVANQEETTQQNDGE